MPTIEYFPEKDEQLLARFSKAFEKVYDAKKVVTDPTAERPGQNKNCIFDFEDGIRLIVSRELLNGKEVVHFSGSVNEALYKGMIIESVLLKKMENKFEYLMQQKTISHLVAFSNKGIPHWICDCVPFNLN